MVELFRKRNCRPEFIRPFIPIAIAVIVGISIGARYPGQSSRAAAAFVLLAALTAWCRWKRRPMLVVPLLFCVVAAYLSIQPWLICELPDHHVAQFVDQGKWQVTGVVRDQPGIKQQRLRFVLVARQLQQGDLSLTVKGDIQITARGRFPHLSRGDVVTLSGHLHGVRNFCNPGGFDYERYMALQGIRCRLYAQGERIRVKVSGQKGWRQRLDHLRGALAAMMEAALQRHPAEVVALMKALTLGDRSGISRELREAFSRVGVSHVLAISGLHIGMVAAAAMLLFRLLLVRIPVALNRLWVLRGSAALGFAPVLAYGFLSGFSPSTQRAVMMVAVFIAGFWVGRLYNWPNVLAVAALTIIVCTPPALLSVSFQLSFTAVWAILLGINAVPELSRLGDMPSWRRWVSKVAALLWVSLLAMVGTLPLVMRYFNLVAWVGPLSNLFVVPLIGILVLPAALSGALCAPVSLAGAAMLWQVAAWGLRAVLWFVQGLSGVEAVAFTAVTPTLAEMALFYFALALLFFWKRIRFRSVLLGMLILAATIDAIYWHQRRFAEDRMIVTAVDVGQGSANLLQLPDGYIVLIDGGGFSDASTFDVGRSILAPLLWRNKIKRVDLVILSHPNSDHLNGLLYILSHFDVGEVWSNHEKASTMGYRQWQEIIKRRKLYHVPFDELPRQNQRAGVRFEILGPPSDFAKLPHAPSWRDENNNSLVVRVAWGNVSFLFTGDIERPAEAELVTEQGAERLRSTILMVPHHGSRTSSSPALVRAVQPREAVVSAGWRNRFHFPHHEVLERFRTSNCRLWRTDHCGAIEITTDGHRYQVESCRPTLF